MRRKKLFWQIFPYYLLIACLIFWGVVSFSFSGVQDTFIEHESQDLIAIASSQTAPVLQRLNGPSSELNRYIEQLKAMSHSTVTIMSEKGDILVDSDADVTALLSLRRPSLHDFERVSDRVSYAVFDKHLFVKMRLSDAAESAYLIMAKPLSSLSDSLDEAEITILLRWGALLFLIVGVVSWITSRALRRSLEQLRDAADRFAAGDLDHMVPLLDPVEVTELAESLNRMSEALNDRIQTILKERNERHAMVSSMIEGVILVDLDGRIRSMNKAARRVLNCEGKRSEGCYVQEIFRQSQMVDFIASVLDSRTSATDMIELHSPSHVYLDVHGTMIDDGQSRQYGAVFVLHDITELKRLETVRQEFVANVSHELRTPITLIQGFIETLEDGALEDPKSAEKFISIIKTHALRLNAIIEDLMILSRLDQEKSSMLDTNLQGIAPVIREAIEGCDTQLSEKSITCTLECDESLQLDINDRLIHQAIFNLIDNAIKYSPENTSVAVRVEVHGQYASIDITDEGPGIPKDHLPHLFGRFYRVDKARSRQFGGTGLGLAIVKHIAKVHGGDVRVESKVGEGSTFSFLLPYGQEGG